MRNVILSALILALAFQTALGEQSGDWTYTVSNNQATITGYTGAGGAVTIPTSVNGLPVVKVGNEYSPVFGWGNSSVTLITIPDSVTSIGDAAFYSCVGLTSVTIGNSVASIGLSAFYGCTSLASVNIPSSVKDIGASAFAFSNNLRQVVLQEGLVSIGEAAFFQTRLGAIYLPSSVQKIDYMAFATADPWAPSLKSISIPERLAFFLYSFLDQGGYDGRNGTRLPEITLRDKGTQYVESNFVNQIANNIEFINTLANNDAFVTAVANKIKSTSENYGLSVKSELEALATKSGLSSAIEPLATKSELTSALTESRTAGVNSVLSNPNLWTLYTTSQIQNMAIGDLVLTKQVNGKFALNYDIEQSEDLKTWTTYRALYLPLNGLPTDKAFVRIKAKQDGASNVSNSQTTPTTPTFGSSYDGGSGVSPNYATPNYNGGASAISPSPDWLNSLPSVPLGPIEDE